MRFCVLAVAALIGSLAFAGDTDSRFFIEAGAASISADKATGLNGESAAEMASRITKLGVGYQISETLGVQFDVGFGGSRDTTSTAYEGEGMSFEVFTTFEIHRTYDIYVKYSPFRLGPLSFFGTAGVASLAEDRGEPELCGSWCKDSETYGTYGLGVDVSLFDGVGLKAHWHNYEGRYDSLFAGVVYRF